MIGKVCLNFQNFLVTSEKKASTLNQQRLLDHSTNNATLQSYFKGVIPLRFIALFKLIALLVV